MSKNTNTFLRIMVAGQVFDEDAIKKSQETFHSVLAQAKVRYGNALCLCRTHPRNLQIKKLQGAYQLAPWPGDGPLHDMRCVFFRDDSEIAPAPPRPNSQVSAVTQGTTHHFYLPLDRDLRIASAAPRPQESVRGDADKPTTSSLQSILYTLWDEADLTRWHPKWQRDWGRARYQILEASQRVLINDESMSNRLFVPRRYREEDQHAINAEFEKFKQSLERKPGGGQAKSGIIIAPVRKMAALPNGVITMYLRHLREGVGLPQSVADYMSNNCRAPYRRAWLVATQKAAINDLERRKTVEAATPGHIPTQEEKHRHPLIYPEVMAIVHVEMSEKGWLWARAAWMMHVHAGTCIPASSPLEVRLVETLMERGYQFQRQLSTESPTNRKIPDWTLRHVYDPEGTGIPRAHLQILSNGADQKLLVARATLANALASKGMPTWTWIPRTSAEEADIPPLPPLDTLLKEPSMAKIHQIHNTQNLNYAYGSGFQRHNQ